MRLAYLRFYLVQSAVKAVLQSRGFLPLGFQIGQARVKSSLSYVGTALDLLQLCVGFGQFVLLLANGLGEGRLQLICCRQICKERSSSLGNKQDIAEEFSSSSCIERSSLCIVLHQIFKLLRGQRQILTQLPGILPLGISIQEPLLRNTTTKFNTVVC